MAEERVDGPARETESSASRVGGRCHWCGYELQGLPWEGVCPECGTAYSERSAHKLQPSPGVLRICCRLGWPLFGLAIVVAISAMGVRDDVGLVLLFTGFAFLIALPANSYFQVRSMLKKHMPEGKRTQGTVAVLRALGTTVCVIAFLAFLAPAVFLGACLIMLSGAQF